MDAGRDRYNQRVEVAFSGLEHAAPTPQRRGFSRALWRRLAAVPSWLAVLRKVTLDLSAVFLVVVVMAYFVSALRQETIVIEAPSVPKALQDRGVTPELLTQLIRARVQSIYAAVGRPEVAASVPIETIKAQIGNVYISHGLAAPANSGNASLDAAAVAMNQAFPAGNTGGGTSAIGPLIAAVVEVNGMIAGEIDRAADKVKVAELAGPRSDPLVIATAGLNLSVDSLAQAARRVLGIESQRRLTVSILCGTPVCVDEALSLLVVATSGDTVIAETSPLSAGDLGGAAEDAADHLLRAYDPRVLAIYYFDRADFANAERVALQVSEDRHARAAWAENLLGLIAMWQEDYAAAAEYFQAALDVDADYVPALVNLGVAHFRTDELVIAQQAFDRALLLNPKHVVAYINLGTAWLRRCNWEEAVANYEKALDVDPQSPTARFALDLVKSIPALRAYVPQTPLAQVSVAGLGSGTKEIRNRRLDEVADAASFCEGLARKPF